MPIEIDGKKRGWFIGECKKCSEPIYWYQNKEKWIPLEIIIGVDIKEEIEMKREESMIHLCDRWSD